MSSSFLLASLGALSASFSSLAIRKTIEYKGEVGGYLAFYFFISFLSAACANLWIMPHSLFSPVMAFVGAGTGVLVIALMATLGLALKTGPTGLTFAFQNSGSVFSPLLMTFAFGASFGFPLSLANSIGMGLVVAGLFWATRGGDNRIQSKQWIFFALATFTCQALILSIYQWRCLLIATHLSDHFLVPFRCQTEEEIWFMPAMFFCAFILQALYFGIRERRFCRPSELIGGAIGGIANTTSTLLLLFATKVATPTENAMLFPLFAVLIIFLCNLYGKFLYQEKVNWAANALLAIGIFVGTLF